MRFVILTIAHLNFRNVAARAMMIDCPYARFLRVEI